MNAKTILAFLGGAAVGAAVALLVAPTSGKELRANIALKGEELKKQIELKLKEKGISRENWDALIGKIADRLDEYASNNEIELAVQEAIDEEDIL
ncbi:MAG: YtxH domain-containing protein [Paludibacteraceae bacterium]|jgi:gas vesicle protein|nr:YtxH domain-containing protein [Paludibacteraceae bacterium]